jgi:histidinol-phosphate aminotransferase
MQAQQSARHRGMTAPTPRPAIMTIAPYVGGEAKAAPGMKLLRLASNEGAYGPPPGAVDAVRNWLPDLHRYPDGSCAALREKLGTLHGIAPAHIVCGAGSDELIGLLVRAYAGAGDEVLYSQYGFLMYGIAAKAAGATPVQAPEKDLCADVDALLAAVTPRTKLVLLANPNNPTGSLLSHAEVVRLHKGLPGHVLLALDAAYCEYVDDAGYSAGDDLVASGNVVVLRTFSKIYALAGPRLGWAHCPPAVADVLNRLRGPFNVAAVAQVAGLAALDDAAFVKHAKAENTKVRASFMAALNALGLHVYPSAGNFVLVRFGVRAEEIRLALKERGILVRQMGAYQLPEYLRITIGTAEEMAIVAAALKEILV